MVDFRIVVQIDPRQAQQGAAKVSKSLRNAERRAAGLRTQIAGALAAFAGFRALVSATRTIAQFSQAMSTVQAITNATIIQFKDLREEAKRLGSTTRFTATQAADGMTFLARAGFEVDEVLGSIEGTLQLAQAGALDLARAADIASNVLKGFRLEVDQTARVVDVLALAANSSNTNVSQLGDAMKFVAPVAAGLGIKIEEAAAAIGALSDAGLQGSLAGTGLRRVLSELESPAKKTNDILRNLGLTADDVRISQVGLTNALITLRNAGVTTGQALELFGDRGGPAFEVLSSSIPTVIEMTAALQNAGGTAERIARIMDDNLNGALLAVKSAYEGFILALGDTGPESAATRFFNGLADAIRFLSANLETAGTAALSLILALTGGPILRVVGVLTGITNATFTLTGALITATRAAKLLGRALLIGFVIESISAIIDEYQRLNKIIEDTHITWGQAGAFAIETFANRVIGGFAALGTIIFTIAKSITDPIIAAFVETGQIIREILADPTGFFSEANDLGARIGKAVADSFNKTWLIGLSASATALNTRFIKLVDDDVFKVLTEPRVVGPAIAPAPIPGFVSEGDGGRAGPTQPAEFAEFLRGLERERILLGLSNQEREIRAGLFAAEDALGQALNNTQRQLVETALRQNQVLSDQDQILQQLNTPFEDLNRQMIALNTLLDNGAISGEMFAVVLRDLEIQALGLQVALGEGSFADTFLLKIAEMTQGVQNLGSALSETLGNAVGTFIDSFSNAITSAIFQSENLGEALRNVAKTIGIELVGSLIKLGLKAALNAAFGQAIAAAATAATVAQAVVVASAWAPAAALASLATLGANAAPAAAAIASTAALSQATAIIPGFADGGLISGPGGSRTDSINARLSNGEFVVNANATRNNLSTLKDINNGGAGGNVRIEIINQIPNAKFTTERISSNQVRIIAKEVARGVVAQEGPKIIAASLTSPNSPMSRAITESTSASRRRT